MTLLQHQKLKMLKNTNKLPICTITGSQLKIN